MINDVKTCYCLFYSIDNLDGGLLLMQSSLDTIQSAGEVREVCLSLAVPIAVFF